MVSKFWPSKYREEVFAWLVVREVLAQLIWSRYFLAKLVWRVDFGWTGFGEEVMTVLGPRFWPSGFGQEIAGNTFWSGGFRQMPTAILRIYYETIVCHCVFYTTLTATNVIVLALLLQPLLSL